MKKLNWCFITDIHFGIRNDNKIFHSYYKKFFEETFFPVLLENNIKILFILGDVFDHRKFINFETLKLAKEIFFDRLKFHNIETHIILGNHDVFYKNTNEVNSVSLILEKDQYPNIHVYENCTEKIVDDVKVLFLPWLNKENYSKSLDLIINSEARFVFSHLELKGFEMHRGIISEQDQIDQDLLKKFEYVFSGHFHHRSNRENIYYLGTPYQMNWSDYGDKKGFYIFDGEKLNFIENKDNLFIKIFYDDENEEKVKEKFNDVSYLQGKFVKIIIKKKLNPILFERILDDILKSNPSDVKIIDETNKIKEEEGEDEEIFEGGKSVFEILENFVNKDLQTDLSKKKLLRYLNQIYNQALNLGSE